MPAGASIGLTASPLRPSSTRAVSMMAITGRALRVLAVLSPCQSLDQAPGDDWYRARRSRLSRVDFFSDLPWKRSLGGGRPVFSGGCRDRELRLGPRGKIRRLLAGDFVGQRDRLTRIRAEIRMRFEVGEHRRDVCGAGEPGRKNFARDLLE